MTCVLIVAPDRSVGRRVAEAEGIRQCDVVYVIPRGTAGSRGVSVGRILVAPGYSEDTWPDDVRQAVAAHRSRLRPREETR